MQKNVLFWEQQQKIMRRFAIEHKEEELLNQF